MVCDRAHDCLRFDHEHAQSSALCRDCGSEAAWSTANDQKIELVIRFGHFRNDFRWRILQTNQGSLMRLRLEGCLFALLTTTFANVARAQQSPVQKGSIQVSGTASLTHERDIGNDVGWTSLELSPRVGYFVARGLAINWNL